MKETLVAKTIDLIVDLFIKFLVYTLKVISPIKILPKEIKGQSAVSNWKNISNIRIKNRLNSGLYDIFVVGISRESFSLKIIFDDGIKGKTVEHMNVNTNYLVVNAKDPQTNNYLWIFRIHKLGPKEALNLSVKIENRQTIYFKTLRHSSVEVPIRERGDGAVAIPFKIEKIPKI